MTRIRDVLKVAIKVLIAKRRNPDAWLPILFDECQSLGGIYVKFLQQIATTELASAQLKLYASHLSVFDDVDTEHIDASATLRRELGQGASELTLVHSKPIATGSFAQVYEARLGDQPVIVKIQRPSLAKYLKIDCFILVAICSLAQMFSKNDLIDVRLLALEYVRTTKQETDYVREALMAEHIRSYYESRQSNIHIPKTYKDISTKRLLVQERVIGMPLTEAIAHGQAGGDTVQYVQARIGSDIRVQLSNMGGELLLSLMQADFVMADPHPGNIFLLPDNNIAFVDFGLVAEGPKHRSAYFKMISQYRALYEDRADMGDVAVAMMAFFDYQLYEALSMVGDDDDITLRLRTFISAFAKSEDLSSDRLAVRRQITQLFMQRINNGNRFAIRFNEGEAILQKAMHGFLGTVRLTFGEQHRSSYYYQTVHAALVAADDEIRRVGVNEQLLQNSLSIERAQEIIVDWLSDIADRDTKTFMSLMKGANI